MCLSAMIHYGILLVEGPAHVSPFCRIVDRAPLGYYPTVSYGLDLVAERRSTYPLISARKASIARLPFAFDPPADGGGGGDGSLAAKLSCPFIRNAFFACSPARRRHVLGLDTWPMDPLVDPLMAQQAG